MNYLRYCAALIGGFIKTLAAVFRWIGMAFLHLVPPALKWSGIVIVAALLSVTVISSAFFLSIEDDKDIILGVIDRVQMMQEDAQAHELERIRAARSQIDARLVELDRQDQIDHCVTTEWEFIDLKPLD